MRNKYDYDKDRCDAYTIAQKNDMPLDLFIQSLKVISRQMIFIGKAN